MQKYRIDLEIPRTDRKVSLVCEAQDSDDAYYLAQALAELMPPTENFYYSKNDIYGTAYWCGSAEPIWN